MADERTPTLEPSRRNSNYTNSTSPHTPVFSRQSSAQEAIFSTPVRSGLQSPLPTQADHVKTSTAGSQSDPRNGIVSRRHRNRPDSDQMDRDNLLVEIGRQKSDIENKNSTIKDLELKLEVSNDAHGDLSYQCTLLEARIKSLEEENSELTKQNAAHSSKVKSLDERLDKANQTIRVQSSQIMNPRDGRNYGPTQTNAYEQGRWDRSQYEKPRPTQHRAITQGYDKYSTSQQQAFDMVPSHGARRMKEEQTPMYHGESTPNDGASSRRGISLVSNPYEGDQYQTSHEHMYYHPAQQTTSDPLATSQGTSFTNQIVPQNYFQPSQQAPSLAVMLSRWYNSAESWSKFFANVPNNETDSQLPTETLGILHQAEDREAIRTLLGNPETRFLAVARLILSSVTNFAFYPLLVRGFKGAYDQRLFIERNKMFTGCPDYIRRDSIANTVAIVGEIVGDPDWEEHIGRLTGERVRALWSSLSPLMAANCNKEDSWRGLYHIMEEGVKIGLMMLQRVSMFGTDFPPAGRNSPFNPANMLSRDSEFNNDPITLARMGLKVRLAFAPVVTETSLELHTNMRPAIVIYARVLLMR